MYAASAVAGVDIPKRVGVAAAPVQDAQAGPHQEMPRQARLPGHHGRIGGVIERVLGIDTGRGILDAVQPAIAQVERLAGRESQAQRGLHSGEIEIVDVQGVPRTVRGSAVVIDAIAHTPVEHRQLAPHTRRRVPVEAAFIGPGALRQNIPWQEWPIIQKWHLIESLLKTIKESELGIKFINLLVNNKPLEDTHLSFIQPWPIEGFKANN